MKKKEAVGELQSQGPVSLRFEGIDLNILARTISKYEGLKKSVNIAQIKEVLRITIQLLSNNFQVSEVVRLLERERIRLTYAWQGYVPLNKPWTRIRKTGGYEVYEYREGD